mmetsp:Transcript_50236/g.60429  ORF Transcript_50236/g.60429 Transcript_50236/m.60429 type:complete len:436 (-) Transcript_50236:247-1554(-)
MSKRTVISTKKPQEASIPVSNFVLLKHIKDNQDVENGLLLVATFIQTINNKQGQETEHFADEDQHFHFQYRVNDEVADGDNGYVKVRRTEQNETVYKTTFDVRAPLEITEVIYDRFPFKIVKAAVVVELSTMTNKQSTMRLRPNLHLNEKFKSCNFSIQLPDEVSADDAVWENGKTKKECLSKKRKFLAKIENKMDLSMNYDFVTLVPEIAYVIKKKDDCSKFHISFYVVEQGFSKFAKTVYPMLLVFFMNIFHVINNSEKGDNIPDATDYIANSATFALTVVFLLETVIPKSRKEEFFGMNTLYILIVILALMLSSVPKAMVHTHWPSFIGAGLFGASFFIPVSNYVMFKHMKRKIRSKRCIKNFIKDKEGKPFKIFKDKFDDHFKSIKETFKSSESSHEGYLVKEESGSKTISYVNPTEEELFEKLGRLVVTV